MFGTDLKQLLRLPLRYPGAAAFAAGALSVMAYIKASYDFDFAGANAGFERALALEPGYATAHQWYGEILATQRRTDEALEQFRLAAKLDPLAATRSEYTITWSPDSMP